MFVDEIYEDILVQRGGKPTTAHIEVVKQKVSKKDYIINIKQAEKGYQLFRTRHPEFSESSFRRHIWVQASIKGGSDEKSRDLFDQLGWDYLTPEQISVAL